MSADAWEYCPKCYKEHKDALETLKELYGVISADEYNAKSNEIKATTPLDKSLRLDYEVYVDRDLLHVVALVACTRCRFKKEYKQEINLL